MIAKVEMSDVLFLVPLHLEEELYSCKPQNLQKCKLLYLGQTDLDRIF